MEAPPVSGYSGGGSLMGYFVCQVDGAFFLASSFTRRLYSALLVLENDINKQVNAGFRDGWADGGKKRGKILSR